MPEWGSSVILAFVFYFAVLGATIWAALGRAHWFLRAVAVETPLVILAAMEAYGAVLTFALMAALGIGLSKCYQIALTNQLRHQKPPAEVVPRQRMQFGIRDLLLLMVVVATAAAVLRRIPADAWRIDTGIWITAGLNLGILTWSCAISVLNRMGKTPSGKPPRPAKWKRWFRGIAEGIAMTLAVVGSAMQVALVANHWYSDLHRIPAAAGRKPKPTPAPLEPLPELPNPNGFDDLIAAERMLAGLKIPATIDERKAFIAEHRAALETARRGLARPCRVPLTYTRQDERADLCEFDQLTKVLMAEAGLASRFSDSVRSYCDMLRLGQASYGGLASHRRAVQAPESIAAFSLRLMRDQLSTEDCKTVLGVVQEIETAWEPLDEQVATEIRWERYVWGQWPNLGEAPTTASYSERSAIENSDRHRRVSLRLLLATVALRWYTLDHWSLPDDLSDLVPTYLPDVPKDPFSDEPLRYCREPDGGYRIYSVGSNGCDDGGERDAKTRADDECW
ncbi:MAG: hypothetical protein ABFD16_16625 [Thermoguttaceae bacterium]|jgi:hypothetical protein